MLELKPSYFIGNQDNMLQYQGRVLLFEVEQDARLFLASMPQFGNMEVNSQLVFKDDCVRFDSSINYN